MARPRDPAVILKARGSAYAAKREAEEPQLPLNVPDCPAFLKGEARKEWKRTVPLLSQMRVLTEADRSTLAMYCAAWGEYVALEQQCANLVSNLVKQGLAVDLPNYPQIAAMRNGAYDRCAKAGARLGFSPADRARLKAQAPETPDEGKGRFFKGRSA